MSNVKSYSGGVISYSSVSLNCTDQATYLDMVCVCVSGGVRQGEEVHQSFRYRPVGAGGCSPAAVQVSHSMQLGWDTLSGLLYKIHRHPIGGERSFQEKSFLLGVGDLPGRD